MTVYELHGGGILHAGEILTVGDRCPDPIYVEPDEVQVVCALRDQDVLDGITGHFVDGKPV